MPITPGQFPQLHLQMAVSPSFPSVHSLYVGAARCSIVEHFEDCSQLAQPSFVIDSDGANSWTPKNDISISSLRDDLLKSGCDGEYVTDEWCKNHHRWISWKLASHDLVTGGSSCVWEGILDELKYRYTAFPPLPHFLCALLCPCSTCGLHDCLSCSHTYSISCAGTKWSMRKACDLFFI